MTKKTLISMILLLAMLAVTGCATAEAPATESTEVEGTTEEVQDTDEATTSNVAVEDLVAENLIEIVYNEGLDENGFFEGVTAADYVDLFDVKNVEIPAEVHLVSDTLVQAEVENLMSAYTSEIEVLDRSIEDFDTVNIDYVGSVDGVDFDGGSTGGNGTYVTIGVTSYIDDFLEQLIGHTPGESFDIEVTFPEDYSSTDLAGKDAVFAITINYISESVLPELTDAFVADNLFETNAWSTVDEMYASIKEVLQEQAIQEYIYTDLLANTPVTSIPEPVMDYQKSVIVNYYKSAANSYGLSLDEFLTSSTEFLTIDDMYVAYADQLDEVSRYAVVVQAIAEVEGLMVTEEALSEYFLAYNGTGDYTEFSDIYSIEYLKNAILQEVAVDYIIDHAQLAQ